MKKIKNFSDIICITNHLNNLYGLSKKKRMLLDGRYEKESFMEKFLTSKDIELKRSLFVRFISQIYVYEDRRIEIIFRYQDEIEQLAGLVGEIKQETAVREVI